MNTMEIVSRIPVNQKAKASDAIKRFLLLKIQEIRKNREVLEQRARREKKNKILEDYKKAIRADQKFKRYKKLQEEIEELAAEIRSAGLTIQGDLLRPDYPYDKPTMISYYNEKKRDKVYLTVAEIPGLQETYDLLDAVEKELDTFSPMDQLETRMMMASTVGEAMAIVNAVADRDVFKVDTEALQLEDKQ